ncbi:hypothetical protein CLU79DRAFT_742489 [Phycomyces nitens]|nr:hypothetical protein CLU79DRAFT_742489 [Phycomyces nitens]
MRIGINGLHLGETPKIQVPSKRKTSGSSSVVAKEKGTRSMTTGHYLNSVASTIYIMDHYPEFKGHYIIMDTAPIHKHADIQKFIESCDQCVYYLSFYLT